MATKWKSWTAQLPVKILCMILVPVMVFIFLTGVLELVRIDVGNSANWEILFTDFGDNNYFFDMYAQQALSQVETSFGYKSEENIRNMGCLEWVPMSHPSLKESWVELTSVNLINSQQTWGRAQKDDIESPAALEMLNGAINNQLYDYRWSKDWIDNSNGLWFYITDGEWWLSNAPEHEAEFFINQPVYLLIENGWLKDQSRQGEWSPYNYSYYGSGNDNITVYIAYSPEAVAYQNSQWFAIQGGFIVQIAIMGGSALAFLALLIILMAGAGRRNGYDNGTVHFTVIDKPWLDISLAAIIAAEAAFCWFIYYSIDAAWRYSGIRWILGLFALLSVGFTLPSIGWVLSFVKRCKAGKWWQHTLIYNIVHTVYKLTIRFVISLWAGFPLTVKLILIAITLTATMAVSIIAPPMCIVFALIITVLLLMYGRRLHLVEKGAKETGAGCYDTPIEVKGGELGSIAASINSISEGIHLAVAERMKSERLKTELITNVSHDIRTPLTSLITYSDLLKNEGLNSERAPEYLEVLIQKSARLKNLTDDLFEASKAASGNIDVNLTNLDLADFIHQVLGELDEHVSESGLDLRLNLPEHAPVLADGKLLWRVMENLLSNVFKYALKGSRVYIDVTLENKDYKLDVKNISDKPLNVDPSELTERFKRGDTSRTDEGSGLGLSIAQSFVYAQGGRFTLSIDGDLFKATIYLPRVN